MSDMLLGIAGLGLIGSLGFGLIRYAGSDNNISSFIKNLLNRNQEAKQEIKVINKKQEILVKQIELSEKASEESKKKINDIIKKASIEVNDVLNKDELANIDSLIKDEWDE